MEQNETAQPNETAILDADGNPEPSASYKKFMEWHSRLGMTSFPTLATGELQRNVYEAITLITSDVDEMFKYYLPEFEIVLITVDDQSIKVSMLDMLVMHLNIYGLIGTKWLMQDGRRVIHIPVPY